MNPAFAAVHLAGSLNRLARNDPMPPNSDVDLHVIQRPMWRIHRTCYPACRVLLAAAPDEERHCREWWNELRRELELATERDVRARSASARWLAGNIRGAALDIAWRHGSPAADPGGSPVSQEVPGVSWQGGPPVRRVCTSDRIYHYLLGGPAAAASIVKTGLLPMSAAPGRFRIGGRGVGAFRDATPPR